LAARADLRGANIDDYDTNTLGVQNIVHACNKCSSIKKVIFASTMLVCKVGYYPETESDYCPPNLYGESKMLGEQIVRTSAPDMKYHWSIVRPTSIWGPWFGPTYRDFFLMLVKRKYINFVGKSSTKTYGYIDNTIYQINMILFSDKTNSKTYYLGDYHPTNITKWASEIADELDYKLKSVPIVFILMASYVGEFLKIFKINFPLNMFRYKNMTTDNIIPLQDTMDIAPCLPVERSVGIKNTIKWINNFYINSLR
jgi:nucleoside-diphosphate-sugar epimerase